MGTGKMDESINSSVILSWLQNRIAEELNCGPDEVDLEATFDLLGLDSVSLLWIAGELAEWLKIEITAALIFETNNLPNLSEKIFELYRSDKMKS
jgi:acyl carrier protein